MVRKNLFGLVLVGGKSQRMKKDKAVLRYHDKPQIEYTVDLLELFCEKVFVSCRKRQKVKTGFERIEDLAKFKNIGPLGGLLSAFSKYPKVSWLILACDLPFVTKKTLEHLLRYRDAKKVATAYRSRFNDLPEPLCAVYEPRALGNHLKFFKRGIFCPRKILINSQTRLLNLKELRALDNVNTRDEYKAAIQFLQNRGKNGKKSKNS